MKVKKLHLNLSEQNRPFKTGKLEIVIFTQAVFASSYRHSLFSKIENRRNIVFHLESNGKLFDQVTEHGP